MKTQSGMHLRPTVTPQNISGEGWKQVFTRACLLFVLSSADDVSQHVFCFLCCFYVTPYRLLPNVTLCTLCPCCEKKDIKWYKMNCHRWEERIQIRSLASSSAKSSSFFVFSFHWLISMQMLFSNEMKKIHTWNLKWSLFFVLIAKFVENDAASNKESTLDHWNEY